MTVTFWGRVGDPDTLAAQQFLRQNGVRPDRALDIDRTPPSGAQWAELALGLGSLAPLVDPRHTDAPCAPARELEAWLATAPARMRAPILLTPKGALAGFRERQWSAFLGVGRALRGG